MEVISNWFEKLKNELYERVDTTLLAGSLKVIPFAYRKITQSRFLPYLPKLDSDIGSGFLKVKANIGEMTLLEPPFYFLVGNAIFGWPENNKQIIRNTFVGYGLWEIVRILFNLLMPNAQIVPGERPIDLPNAYSMLMAGFGMVEMYLIKKVSENV